MDDPKRSPLFLLFLQAFRAQDVEGRDPGGGWVRVVTPHTAITKDMRQERLNVHVGEDGVVNEFRFY